LPSSRLQYPNLACLKHGDTMPDIDIAIKTNSREMIMTTLDILPSEQEILCIDNDTDHNMLTSIIMSMLYHIQTAVEGLTNNATDVTPSLTNLLFAHMYFKLLTWVIHDGRFTADRKSRLSTTTDIKSHLMTAYAAWQHKQHHQHDKHDVFNDSVLFSIKTILMTIYRLFILEIPYQEEDPRIAIYLRKPIERVTSAQ
jgi:hypothetical protein